MTKLNAASDRAEPDPLSGHQGDVPIGADPDDFLDNSALTQILAQSDRTLAHDILAALHRDLSALLPALKGDSHHQRTALHNLAALAGTVGAHGLATAAIAASAAMKSPQAGAQRADLHHLIPPTMHLIDALARLPAMSQDAE